MKERLQQIKIYFTKFIRLFISTGGWKAFLFGGVISLIITWVVGDGMFVYSADTESGCFTMVSACIWIGIFNSIQSICKERDIIKREHRSGMHISSYIISRAIYELIVCAIQALIMLLMCSLLLELPSKGIISGKFEVDMYITFFVLLLAADYLGVAVSSIVKNTTTAMTVMPFILIIQLVLSGALFELDGNLELISRITISKWGMEALGAMSDINSLPYNAMGLQTIAREAYDYSQGHIVSSLFLMLIFAFVYILLGIISLEFVDNDKR